MRFTKTLTFFLAAALAGCGGSESETVAVSNDAPEVTFTADEKYQAVAGKKLSPVSIAYRVIGKPVVGQPVVVDVSVQSNIGPSPIELDYRIPDATSMEFPQSQARTVALAVGEDQRRTQHQVTVVPQREGRLYLNVSASVETPDGTMSTVTAIPVQVGSAPRELQENGTVVETEDGELLRTMPAGQN